MALAIGGSWVDDWIFQQNIAELVRVLDHPAFPLDLTLTGKWGLDLMVDISSRPQMLFMKPSLPQGEKFPTA